MFNKLKKFLKSKRAVGSVATAIKVGTACVLGAAVLVGGVALINDVVLPNTSDKVQNVAEYEGDGAGGGSTGGVTPVNVNSGETYEYSQVNPIVQEYLSNVTYDSSDYSVSYVSDYSSVSTSYRKDQPAGFTIDLLAGTLTITDNASGGSYTEEVEAGLYTFYNIAPGVGGDFIVEDEGGNTIQQGHLSPTGTLRMIKTTGTISNVRDIGGWICDGGTVKYGKIFRGSEPYNSLSDSDYILFNDVLEIKNEINLTSGSELGGRTASSFGSETTMTTTSSNDFTYSGVFYYANRGNTKTCFESIMDSVINNDAVYIHCVQGADRTGTVCFIIEALLGMNESDISKDFELTSFSSQGHRERETLYDGVIKYLKENFVGDSLSEKTANYLTSLGISLNKINSFRAHMIDGTPTTISANTNKNLVNMTYGNYRIFENVGYSMAIPASENASYACNTNKIAANNSRQYVITLSDDCPVDSVTLSVVFGNDSNIVTEAHKSMVVSKNGVSYFKANLDETTQLKLRGSGSFVTYCEYVRLYEIA